ncbi:MAG TPA: hypothetical protein DCZ91_16565 [Lachnospiraceae bacterium]|nr:hypothetical protein [Lachnospiraceae bacterium]
MNKRIRKPDGKRRKRFFFCPAETGRQPGMEEVQMEERTMVKVLAGGNGVYIRTVSRRFRSPCSFPVEEEQLKELQEKGRCSARKGYSAADMARFVLPLGEDCVQIGFMWLEGTGDGCVSGYAETVFLLYQKFWECIEACRLDGKERSLLSVPVRRRPRIEIISGRNLREVAGNRTVRKKFGRFISRKLNWPQYQRIVLSDDREPYSFGFAGYTTEGLGMCGGIILQGQDDLKSASYGIHT